MTASIQYVACEGRRKTGGTQSLYTARCHVIDAGEYPFITARNAPQLATVLPNDHIST